MLLKRLLLSNPSSRLTPAFFFHTIFIFIIMDVITEFNAYLTLKRYPMPCYVSSYRLNGLTSVTHVTGPLAHLNEHGQVSNTHISDDNDGCGPYWEPSIFIPEVLGPIEPPIQGCQRPPFQGPLNDTDWHEDWYYKNPNDYWDFKLPHLSIFDMCVAEYFLNGPPFEEPSEEEYFCALDEFLDSF